MFDNCVLTQRPVPESARLACFCADTRLPYPRIPPADSATRRARVQQIVLQLRNFLRGELSAQCGHVVFPGIQ